MNSKIQKMCFVAVMAALYVVLTVINPIGYGMIQLRVSAIMSIIPFWDKRFRAPCLLGVVVANLFSPMGFVDVLCGAVIWLIAYFVIDRIKIGNYGKSVAAAFLSGAIVGLELCFVAHAPFLLSFASVTLSQLIVFTVGYPIIQQMGRMKIINK